MRQQPSQHIKIAVNPEWRVGIVASSFYEKEMNELIESAHVALLEAGITHISLHTVPGSFEIPVIGKALVETGKVDALIALGIIVQGETHHAELLATQTARGIMDVQTQHGIPFAFEILHVDSIDQARERLNKGKEAADAVLGVLGEIERIGDGR